MLTAPSSLPFMQTPSRSVDQSSRWAVSHRKMRRKIRVLRSKTCLVSQDSAKQFLSLIDVITHCLLPSKQYCRSESFLVLLETGRYRVISISFTYELCYSWSQSTFRQSSKTSSFDVNKVMLWHGKSRRFWKNFSDLEMRTWPKWSLDQGRNNRTYRRLSMVRSVHETCWPVTWISQLQQSIR